MVKDLERLYKWRKLTEDPSATSEAHFFEIEKRLLLVNIRTRVSRREEGAGYALWVPKKDYEYAKALFEGEVKEIVTHTQEIYHVFNEDLTFKNEVLYKNKFAGLVKNQRWKYYIITAIILLMMFVIVRFVKMP